MKTRFLARCIAFLAALLFACSAKATPFSLYVDTGRVTLGAGAYYYPGTGVPGSIEVRNSYGYVVSGCSTTTCQFNLINGQVTGFFTVNIPSPGTYSFSFPAQNGSGVRYYTALYTLVTQGNVLVLSGGQGSWIHGEGFPYYSVPTSESTYVMALPSGPLSTLYSSGYIRVKAPLARAGHYFALEWQTVENGPTFSATTYNTAFVTNGTVVNGNAAGQLESLLVVIPTGSVPASVYDWWLRDTTANQKSAAQVVSSSNASSVLYANPSVIGLSWSQVGGSASRYFAIPDSRRYDNLGMWQSGTLTSISKGYYTLGTYSGGETGAPVPIGWFVGSAIGPIEDSSVYIGDTTTGERASNGATDARSVYAWSVDPAYAFYPTYSTQVTLHSREAGHLFAVHSKVIGGPVYSRVFTAAASGANAKLVFDVGKGLQFWVTREAENGSASQPVAPAGASASGSSWVATSNNATFGATSFFPANPARLAGALVSRPVRINAAMHGANGSNPPGRSFMVQLGDGYTTTYAPPNGAAPTYGSSIISDWNGVPFPSGTTPLPIYTFNADTDWRFDVTLRDLTSAEVFTPSDIENRIDWLAPWVAPNPGAPAGPTITLNLPLSRLPSSANFYSSFLARPDLNEPGVGNPPVRLSRTATAVGTLPNYILPGLTGLIDPFGVPIRSIEFTNPTPAVPGSFPLMDLELDDPTPITVHADTNDLRTWFAPPLPIEQLQISTSRWDHVLRLCQQNGESFPITRKQMEGNMSISADPNSTGTFQSYYFFTASTAARPGLPWYIEDLSTDPVQRRGPIGTGSMRPTDAQLTTWYHLPTPKGLTGTISTGQRMVELVWSRTGASLEGAFEIERKLTAAGGSSTGWLPVRSLPYFAGQSSADGSFIRGVDGLYHFKDAIPDSPFLDPSSAVGRIRSYRVRYKYGTPADYSTWTDEVSLAGWADADGDGLPDAWEIANFGTMDRDGTMDSDGDTQLNSYEFVNHTNPNARDTSAPGSTLIVYTPFQ